MIRRISHLVAGVGVFVALVLTITVLAAEAGTKSVHLNPITLRSKIIEENMRRLRSLRTDAKFMSEDQEEAIGILATYRSAEAAPKLVEIIMVKRRARKPFSLMSGGRRTRLGKPSEYPAVAALVSIGLPSVWAIRDNLDTFSKAQPEVKRVELYAKVIRGVFPSNLVRALGVEMKEGAPKKSKHAYDKFLKLPDMNPPRIRIQREPDLEAFP